ncbi:MAG: GNAT family N-acetyltransferase [Candidatus Sericytochromatia bacterium]
MKVIPADALDLPLAFAIRRAVFVNEQKVPEAEEFDEYDAQALHLLAWAMPDQAVGTARLRLLDGWAKFERIAVLAAWRGQGVGQALVLALLEQARAQGYRRFRLNAQCRAEGFYGHFGFTAVGPEFLDAGILHREMRLEDPEMRLEDPLAG